MNLPEVITTLSNSDSEKQEYLNPSLSFVHKKAFENGFKAADAVGFNDWSHSSKCGFVYSEKEKVWMNEDKRISGEDLYLIYLSGK